MPRQRTSPVWKLSREEFQKFVYQCNSRVEILEKLGLNGYSGNHKTLNERIKEDGIDIDHILENRKKNIQKAIFQNTTPLEKILIENSTYKEGNRLKRRLIKEGLLKDQCYECGQLPIWNNKPLVLHLDHINGIHTDNRLDNLRILCPHCHSQTPTFSGRNARAGICAGCGKKIKTGYAKCMECENKSRRDKNTKTLWPANEDLLKMIEEFGFVRAAKSLGVSDNAIRHRLKRRGLI